MATNRGRRNRAAVTAGVRYAIISPSWLFGNTIILHWCIEPFLHKLPQRNIGGFV